LLQAKSKTIVANAINFFIYLCFLLMNCKENKKILKLIVI
jgi:hypothetical protein